MLNWSFAFLVLALVAALFGFTGIASGAAAAAKVLFFVFLVIWVLSFAAGALTKNT